MHPVFRNQVISSNAMEVPLPVIPISAVYFHFEIDEFSGICASIELPVKRTKMRLFVQIPF